MDRNREDYFEEDPRYRQCNREALISVAVFLVSFVIIGGVSLLLGYGKPGDEIRLVAGFPAWFFYGAMVVVSLLTPKPPQEIVQLFWGKSAPSERQEEVTLQR
jgi:hypothetical protein